jgi:membrane-bound ClpP family serine protease
VAKTDIKEKGKGYGHGGPWNAEADEPIAADEKVIVIVVRGMTVKVEKERGAVW